MKKWTVCLLVLCLMTGFCVNALAADLGGTVTYNGSTLTSDYTTADITDAVGAMQPGDSITFAIKLVNKYAYTTDWWMHNDVFQNFEDAGKASGGAYTYVLTYTAPSGAVTTLYNSDTVGGEADNAGLSDATSSLKNYFYLGILTSQQTATVTLKVTLDGETQGNNYQKALAGLNMRFAVENVTGNSDVIKTGDNTAIVPYIIAAAVSGIALLAIAVVRLRKSDRRKQGGQTV